MIKIALSFSSWINFCNILVFACVCPNYIQTSSIIIFYLFTTYFIYFYNIPEYISKKLNNLTPVRRMQTEHTTNNKRTICALNREIKKIQSHTFELKKKKSRSNSIINKNSRVFLLIV